MKFFFVLAAPTGAIAGAVFSYIYGPRPETHAPPQPIYQFSVQDARDWSARHVLPPEAFWEKQQGMDLSAVQLFEGQEYGQFNGFKQMLNDQSILNDETYVWSDDDAKALIVYCAGRLRRLDDRFHYDWSKIKAHEERMMARSLSDDDVRVVRWYLAGIAALGVWGVSGNTGHAWPPDVHEKPPHLLDIKYPHPEFPQSTDNSRSSSPLW